MTLSRKGEGQVYPKPLLRILVSFVAIVLRRTFALSLVSPFRAEETPHPQPAVVGVLLLALLGAGCGRANPFQAIERGVRAELPQLIGPADEYQVSVSRSGGTLIAGRISWIDIHGRNVRAVEGLNLDDLKIRLENVRFSRSDRTVREIERSQFEARISAASVTQFIRRRSPNLRDVRVRIAGGKVHVHAAPALLGIGVPVDVEGKPELRSAASLHFNADRVAVLRLGLPEFAIQRLEARVNPLADLAALRFPLQLTTTRIDGDRLVVAGTATFTAAQFQR